MRNEEDSIFVAANGWVGRLPQFKAGCWHSCSRNSTLFVVKASTDYTFRMKGGERVQLSILMPILRTEIARLEITPDEILLVDRMNKRYVRASRSELNDILPKEARFSKLEKLLLDASLPEGKSELSGKELGIPSLEKAKVRLYDFSSKEFVMTPTEISDRYTQVPLTELLNMLTKL